MLYKRTTSGSPSDPDDLTITGLDYAGDYTVTVTDGSGCSTTEVITLDDGSNEDPFTVGETPRTPTLRTKLLVKHQQLKKRIYKD